MDDRAGDLALQELDHHAHRLPATARHIYDDYLSGSWPSFLQDGLNKPHTITYADGSSREFYRIGLSANTTGISVYVLGLDDKTYLARTYGGSIGKASVTGYCIKFRHLAVINVDVLQAAIQYGMSVHQAG